MKITEVKVIGQNPNFWN